jgi:hypothetical protein
MVHKMVQDADTIVIHNGRIYIAVRKKLGYDRYVLEAVTITTRNGQWGVPIMVPSVRVNAISLQQFTHQSMGLSTACPVERSPSIAVGNIDVNVVLPAQEEVCRLFPVVISGVIESGTHIL